MLQKKAITRQVCVGLHLSPLFQSRIDCPIGRVDRCSTHAVPMSLQESAHSVALLGRVPLFEKRITK
jgi:hypothetical protein